LGFALQRPEQAHDNNRGRCFDWFRPSGVRRSGGEGMPIRQMLRIAIARRASEPKRVYIVGFSAGGGVAAAMLHTRWADPSRPRQVLAGDVRDTTRARPRTSWPRISIWHGSRERAVDPANAGALAMQRGELHRQVPVPKTDELAPGHRRRTSGRPARPPAAALRAIRGFGHRSPVDPDAPAGGHAGPRVVTAALSAARLNAALWLPDRSHAASAAACR
jgi:poly(3-hydroxybutyrate) depolymerase